MKNSLINKISDLIKPGAYKLQFAVNRQWENALKIDLNADAQLTDSQLTDFIGNDAQIVAGELFFKVEDGTDCYIGVQWDNSFVNARVPFDFIRNYIDTALNNKQSSFYDFLRILGKNLYGNSEIFIHPACTAIDLGVVDFWMSMGPVHLWKQSDDTRTTILATTESIIQPFSHILENNNNYVGLEFVYTDLPKHWLSLQVSKQSDAGTWVLDLTKLKRYLEFYNYEN